ncbi:holin family protein [Azomonas macrocytogenes]|uniref:Holin of 3TMs, for gene-transfer release n=1 Tax=Azomonas macrocytogenes TaxID=69962 RepID=A0A839T4X0_AZOMA|nr:holin family protein [Azomonas macrocytogenes]MBB3103810.1 hypothetical protein [Azomonas macrocytogenes]
MSIVGTVLGALLPQVSDIINRVLPDPEAQAKAQMELLKLQYDSDFKQLDADLQINLAQAKINEIEAQSQTGFQALGRPLCLLACAVGLWYQFLLRPLLPWILTVCGVTGVPELPSLDDSLWELTFAMLGLGTLRTADRWKRVDAVKPK